MHTTVHTKSSSNKKEVQHYLSRQYSPLYILYTVKNDKAHKHNPKIHKIMKLSSNSINPTVDVHYRANTDEKFLGPLLNVLSRTELSEYQ